MKAVRLTQHALERCRERGVEESEVTAAVEWGSRERVREGRTLCRFTFPFAGTWQGRHYLQKQVTPIIIETPREIVVITVLAYYY